MGNQGGAGLTKIHTGQWHRGYCLPTAKPWSMWEGKDRARPKGTGTRQVDQALEPEEPYFQNWVKTGNWGSDMDPIIKVGHESRVGEAVKPAMQNPEFQDTAHLSLLLQV